MKRLFTALAIALGLATQVQAQSLTPFSTTTTKYVYVGGSTSASSSKIHTTTSASPVSFNSGTSVNSTYYKINGLGLNSADGFLYGMMYNTSCGSSSSASSAWLCRMGSNGATTKVGTIYPPTVSGSTWKYINTAAGVVDCNGKYWCICYVYMHSTCSHPFNANYMRMYIGSVANIGSLPANSSATLSVSWNQVSYLGDTYLTSMMQQFLNGFNYCNPTSNAGGIEDIALNPTDGNFYTYFNYTSGNGCSAQNRHRPAKINPLTWTASTVGTNYNTNPNAKTVGTYFTPSGAFYVLFNNKQYAAVNLTTGSLSGLCTTTLPVSSSGCGGSGGTLRGDLASSTCATVACPPPPPPVDTTPPPPPPPPVDTTPPPPPPVDTTPPPPPVDTTDDGGGGTEARGGEGTTIETSFVTVFPTVVTDNVFYAVATGEGLTLDVYSMNGQIVATQPLNGKGTRERVTFDKHSGIFIVQIKDSKGSVLYTSRIVRQ